jgi:hypothetical protein
MDAGVAQQVEQLIRNQQVTSSNLVAGSRWLCEAFNSNLVLLNLPNIPSKSSGLLNLTTMK